MVRHAGTQLTRGALLLGLLSAIVVVGGCAKGSSGPTDAAARDSGQADTEPPGSDGSTDGDVTPEEDSGPGNCVDDDEDGVCNDEDVCPGSDDTIDTDGDGVPNGCDACEGASDDADADGDGTPDACDCDQSGDVCDEHATCTDGIAGVNCACMEGYGGDGRTCTPGGCGPPPPAPDNGSVDAPDTSTGSTATYSCDSGYELVGDATSTCQTDGTWSGTTPTCEPVDCGSPGEPTNGSVSVSSTTFESTATWSCDTGYVMSGGSSATCQADGTWSASPPSCDPVDCGTLPGIENGSVVLSGTTYESTATYSCNSGYDLLGDSTRTCQADGTWSGSAPTCASSGCGTPSAPVNGSVSAPSTDVDDRAYYSCDSGYQLRRGTQSICTSSGWLGATPDCENLLTCACGGPWVEGGRVRAAVSSPASASGISAGDLGTVIAAKSSGLDVLVEWDGWSSGHSGNCSFAECGSCSESGSSRWWVDCTEITPLRLRCACSGAYAEGDRVVALVDSPASATGISQGHLGTVLVGQSSGLEILVQWDSWSSGHSGNCSFADCGQCTDSGSSRWWVDCDEIGRAP